MFITFPTFELHPPAGRLAGDVRSWRMMQLPLHVPWFMVSVEVVDPETTLGRVQTFCFAREDDLTTFFITVEAEKVRGLVCMTPGWMSVSGTWTSHEVRQVWRATTAAGTHLVLSGADGQTLDVQLSSIPSEEETERTLLIEIKPAVRQLKRKAAASRRPS
ncbi:hypothetical protein [Roseateles sp. P5_E7]